MATPLDPSVHKPKQAIGRRLPKRRDDSGLTTLEWLLIVAAVAGLAALAVVLVQNVVSDTSEQIAGSSARKTAARVAAAEITDKARAATASSTLDRGSTAKTARRNRRRCCIEHEFKSDCKRLAITFGDVKDLKVWWRADADPGHRRRAGRCVRCHDVATATKAPGTLDEPRVHRRMILWSRSGPRRSAEANAGPIAEREQQVPAAGRWPPRRFGAHHSGVAVDRRGRRGARRTCGGSRAERGRRHQRADQRQQRPGHGREGCCR